ncbi:two-pore calcium channel 2 [Plakobranchus ocellatus]|uniref:Two-pore calcium channel 2 n=1 Tax=Plakobranchus ocellatus TaxID=259542 RepID=A0AAV4CNE2_9GAST|nr:two-pore calcium channel 2 [Plakobranchus ocellatus]
MDYIVVSDKASVLHGEDNASMTREDGSLAGDRVESYTGCDIDTSSTCLSGSWRSDVEVDMPSASEPSASRIFQVNEALDMSLSASLDGQIFSAGIDEESILQAVVFIEDAFNYRSIDHKVSTEELNLYRVYKSRSVHIIRVFVITLLHLLAFVEYPSSLTVSSDPRYRSERVGLPCWLTQSTELLCLALLLVDNIIRVHLMGVRYFVQQKWDILSVIAVLISFVDWCVSFSMGCREFIRFRRILRPYFLMQNSSLMKKIVRCLRMTMPEVISVLLLLFFHLYIFTLLGMLMFPELQIFSGNSTSSGGTDQEDKEGSTYFKNLLDSFISLLVLLTTANNPDVTLPAYSQNRFAAIFFILYLMIEFHAEQFDEATCGCQSSI